MTVPSRLAMMPAYTFALDPVRQGGSLRLLCSGSVKLRMREGRLASKVLSNYCRRNRVRRLPEAAELAQQVARTAVLGCLSREKMSPTSSAASVQR
jgi:hypothetical protein